MTLYEQWRNLAETASANPAAQQQFWGEYFAAETENYKVILEENTGKLTGTVKELAEKFGMSPVVFSGFIDGINTSLTAEVDLDTMEEETALDLTVDFEKLYFNMHDAKAKWLYTLPQWEGVLPEDRRREIARDWRNSVQAVSQKKVGRNDPCPCGSGKKYKKCCGIDA